MPPDGEASTGAGAGEQARRSNRVENGSGFAFADEIGMRPSRPETRVVRSRNDVAPIEHLPEALDTLEAEERQ
jgi:hypothetical protein